MRCLWKYSTKSRGLIWRGCPPPLNDPYRGDRDILTGAFVKGAILFGSDVVGSGLESASEPPGQVNLEWPILNHHWRGSVVPNDTVRKYWEVCETPFSFESLISATDMGGQLVKDYGGYPLAAREVQEATVRRKDHLCNSASHVACNGPILTDRLKTIHTI